MRNLGVDVPNPVQLFRKMLFEIVDVEIKDPTVSCDVVATRPVPAALAVIIPLLGNDTPRARVPDVVIGLPEIVNPVGTEKSTDVTVPEF
jgi:hypothetical protein